MGPQTRSQRQRAFDSNPEPHRDKHISRGMASMDIRNQRLRPPLLLSQGRHPVPVPNDRGGALRALEEVGIRFVPPSPKNKRVERKSSRMKEHVEVPKDYRIYVAISSGRTSPGGWPAAARRPPGTLVPPSGEAWAGATVTAGTVGGGRRDSGGSSGAVRRGGKSVRYTTLDRCGVRPPAPAPSSRP